MDDAYHTIKSESQIEIKVKGSRFIGETRLSSDPDSALAALEQIRKREYNATHHCWAYRVGLGAECNFKYSDDGEPSGTAGKPIYDVLEGRDLTNTLVVVTRYYGGTKLGTGGLVRAYGEAAREALDKSGVREHYLTDTFDLELAFPAYNLVQQLVARLEATIVDSTFTDTVALTVTVRRSRTNQFESEFIEITQGKATIRKTDDA